MTSGSGQRRHQHLARRQFVRGAGAAAAGVAFLAACGGNKVTTGG